MQDTGEESAREDPEAQMTDCGEDGGPPMARADDTPSVGAVPDPDRLEQEQPADPRDGELDDWSIPQGRDADEADLLEQAQDVVGAPEEEYEPDPT